MENYLQIKKLRNIIGWIIIVTAIFVFIIVISKIFFKITHLEFKEFSIFDILKPGSEAPEFVLKDLTGNEIKLSDIKGKKNIILYFWSTYCPPCKKLSRLLQKFYEKYKGEVEILAISTDFSKSAVKKYIKKYRYDFITLLDNKNKVQQLYGIFGPPSIVLINKDGKIRSMHIGYQKDIIKKLEGELKTPIKYPKESEFVFRSKKSVCGLHRQGKRYMEKGEYEKAIDCFERLIKIGKKSGYEDCVYEHLAFLYPKVGKIDKAIWACKKDLRISPKDTRTIGQLGYLYSISGNYNKSVEMYKKLVKLTPKSAVAHYNLGEAYINIGEINLAINELEKSVELNPKDFQPYILLGKTYNSIGNFEKAIKTLNKAIEINPTSSTTFYELGFVYENIGNKEEAIKWYNKALSINKYDIYAKAGLQRLKK